MKARTRTLLLAALLGAIITPATEAGDARPAPVSPGSMKTVMAVGDECPTFSWSGTRAARGYDVVVYQVAADSRLGEPLIQRNLAAPAFSWTPAVGGCLERGKVYAWSVGAKLESGETRWSSPAFFEITHQPSRQSFQEALAIMRDYLQHETPERRSAAVGPRPENPVVRPVAPTVAAAPSALGGSDFSIDSSGNVEGMSFTGDGSGLTGVTTGFGSVTGGTNTVGLLIGTGGSLAPAGSGTIAATSVPASGVTGAGAGSGLDADLLDGNSSSFFQQRVSSLCAAGSSIREIKENGTVVCETDDTGGAGDNLGDHIATQNIVLGVNYLSGDGGAEGIRVSGTGNVGMGGVTSPQEALHLGGNIRLPEDGQLQFGGASENRIWESSVNLNIDAFESSGSDVQIGASHFIEIEAPNIFIEAEDNDVDISAADDINLQPGLPDRVFVDGDLTVGGSCSGCSSDEDLKQNIRRLAGSLDRLGRIRGVSFDWVPDSREFGDWPGRNIGVVAQEVARVFPELVGTDSRGYRFVRYQKLVAPLIEAVKELEGQNQNLRDRLEALERQARPR